MEKPCVLEICCHERPHPSWLLLTERMPDGSSVGEDMLEWEGRRKLHTGDVVCDIFDGPPITQWGKERWKGALRADKVDDAELVVDVQRADFVLEDEALLKRSKGSASTNKKQQR